jgi:GTP-binding protein
VIIRSAEFEISAVRQNQWPADGLPEFAFVGRSNVGKSTLLNGLLRRKALAKTSSKPGKTQQINFFRINQSFRFADLPGYGYAAVSKSERLKFMKMTEEYLTRRESLARIFHLIDIRHVATDNDIDFHRRILDLALPITVIATKSDKISKSQVNVSISKIRDRLATPYPIIAVSAEKKSGLDGVWATISADLEADAVAQGLQVEPGLGQEHTEKDE